MSEQPTGFTVQGKVLKPGTVLFKEGDKIENVYRVEDGSVGLYRGEKLVGTLGRGCFVGAAAVLSEAAQPYTVRGTGTPMTYLSEYRGHDATHAFAVDAELARELYGSLSEEQASLGAPPAGGQSLEHILSDQSLDVAARVGRVRAALRDKAQQVLFAAQRA